jgi:hypothetical protein
MNGMSQLEEIFERMVSLDQKPIAVEERRGIGKE